MKAKKDYKKGGKVKRKVTKGGFDVEVDGKTRIVEGKKVEKRGGKVVKFKAKGAGMKIKDKMKFGKDGLVKKDKRQTRYK